MFREGKTWMRSVGVVVAVMPMAFVAVVVAAPTTSAAPDAQAPVMKPIRRQPSVSVARSRPLPRAMTGTVTRSGFLRWSSGR